MRRSEHRWFRGGVTAWALRVVLAILAVTLPVTVSAQSFSVGLSYPPEGAEITFGATFYDVATERVTVSGAFTYPTGSSDYQLKINGRDFDPVWTTTTSVPDAVLGTTLVNFTTKLFVPVDNQLHTPIDLRLTQRSTGLYKVARRTLMDLRQDANIRPRRPRLDVAASLGVQVTTNGLNQLEAAHTSSLPQPDLASFNGRLTQRAAGGPTLSVAQETRFKDADKACMPLSTAREFLGTQAWAQVYDAARAHYTVYQAVGKGSKALAKVAATTGPAGVVAATAIKLGAAVYKNLECVRELPDPSGDQFEVCAGTIEGEVSGMSLDGVLNVDLEFVKGGARLSGDDTTAPVHTLIDGRQTQLFVRWAVPHGACTMRPDVALSAGDEVMVAPWAACSLEAVDDTMFTAKPGKAMKFDLAALGETFATSVVTPATFTKAPLTRHVIPPASTCASPAFTPGADALINLLATNGTMTFSDTWNEAAPYPVSHQVQALDDLLAPLELGAVDPFDQRRTLTFAKLEAPVGKAGGADGLVGVLDSDVGQVTLASAATLFYTPGTEDVTARQMPAGNDSSGAPFDLSYTVGTTFINQVLANRSQDPRWFGGRLDLTWHDFGVAPPAGVAGDAAAVLDYVTLPSLHPAFAGLGLTRDDLVRLYVIPIVQPFVNIPREPLAPDGSVLPAGHAPITYQMSRVNLVLEKKVPGGVWEPILRFVLDFYDPDFQMDLDPAGGPYLLTAMSDRRLFGGTPTAWKLPGCPLQASGPGDPPTCSEEVTGAILTPALAVLEGRLRAMVADLPAPQRFDAAGHAALPRVLDPVNQYVWDQMITFFATVIPEPTQP